MTLFETWEFSSYPKVRAELLRQAVDSIGDRFSDKNHKNGYIDITSRCGIDLLGCAKALPHTDPAPMFLTWSALWILQASSGHRLKITSPASVFDVRVPKELVPEITPIKIGHVVLFNEHKTHWMDQARDKSVMFAAIFTFKSRPTRDKVEERIRLELKKNMKQFMENENEYL
jgi:hypothetical protein